MIPQEAVEAAAKAVFDVRDDAYDMDEWEDLDSTDRELFECQARAALEASAPFLRAQAIKDAAKAIEALRPEMGPGINITQYREGRNDAFVRAADVCTARAATERGQG